MRGADQAACLAKRDRALSRLRLSGASDLMEAVREANAIGNLVFDAQIVALCRESGISRVVTEDRDFDRFKGLDTERIER